MSYSIKDEDKLKLKGYYPNISEEDFDNIALNRSTENELAIHLECDNIEIWPREERIIESDTIIYKYTDIGVCWLASKRTELAVVNNIANSIIDNLRNRTILSELNKNVFMDATNEEKKAALLISIRLLKEVQNELYGIK
jgi:hypothetical protein